MQIQAHLGGDAGRSGESGDCVGEN